MDLLHELCPVQLLEVTKKSDNLSGWLTSIQHLAYINGIDIDYWLVILCPIYTRSDVIRIFDKDGDGFVSKKEFKWMTANKRISKKKIDLMFQVLDINKTSILRWYIDANNILEMWPE